MKVLRLTSREVSLDEVLNSAAEAAVEVMREGRVKAVVLNPEHYKAMTDTLDGMALLAHRSVPVTALSEETIVRMMEAVPEGDDYSLDDVPDVEAAPSPGR